MLCCSSISPHSDLLDCLRCLVQSRTGTVPEGAKHTRWAGTLDFGSPNKPKTDTDIFGCVDSYVQGGLYPDFRSGLD